MRKLDELIAELCPDGVEYKQIGDVILSLNTGLNPRRFFKLNTDDAQNYYVTIREMHGGRIVFSEKTDRINDEALRLCNNRANGEKGDVLFSGTGTIGETVVLEETPTNWNIKEGVYAIKPNPKEMDSKFLSHLLGSSSIKTRYMKKVAGGTVKSIPMAELKLIAIPAPPLEVQREIVHILDDFTLLTAELTAELTARRKQYEYYRDKLLSFEEMGGQIHRMPLKSIANVFRGDYITKKGSIAGNIPVILGGQEPAYYINKSNHEGEIVVVARSGASAGFVSYWNESIYVTDGFGYEAKKGVATPRYLYYSLKRREKELNEMKRGAGVPHVSGEMLAEVEIPIPSLDVQDKLVNVLDYFESICSDLNTGLPAEIEARQKQYEYYRDRLLDFKEKE